MLTFQNSHLFTFLLPKTLEKSCKPRDPKPKCFPQTTILQHSGKQFSVNALGPGEFPVDETLLERFGPKEKLSEDEARRLNWIERGWAPWDEILSPEAKFARASLNEGVEIPLQTPDAVEAFKMLTPKGLKKKIEEMGLTEEEYFAKLFEIQGEIPEPLKTVWAGPVVVRHIPPRDWPPRGWEVDRKELEFIREAHKLQAVRVDLEKVEEASTNTDDMCLERYKVFLKQYNEWVSANKDRLEEESYKFDQDYYPGRRKRGNDYKEGMYELPFYYPGQICAGKVTTLHLYQGAFVDIGGVYDGWVPIKRNDWFWIRHHIKVGMPVIVEILAKRDPYRFRFPIEMRFVDPNIDHLIFNRFEFPPIFHHEEESSPDEIRRDCGRPPIPVKDPEIKVEEEPLPSNHPYVDKLWPILNAEQMVLDDMEANPDKYKDKKWRQLADYDEENCIEYSKVRYKKTVVPKVVMKIGVKQLDLEAALAERQLHNKLRKEAKERGEEYKITRLRRNEEMDEYDFMHWRRSFEEREALIRDISCRRALGLPLEEPGRFVDSSYFGKDLYDPSSPLYRVDYWGEPKNSEKSKQLQISNIANDLLVPGDAKVWFECSYNDDATRMQMGSQSKGVMPKEVDEQEYEGVGEQEEEEEEEDDDDADYICSILSSPNKSSSDQPAVNGTESSRIPLEDDSLYI